MGTETKGKENKLGGSGLSSPCGLALYPTLPLELSDPGSLDQQKSKAMKRRQNTFVLV